MEKIITHNRRTQIVGLNIHLPVNLFEEMTDEEIAKSWKIHIDSIKEMRNYVIENNLLK